jgi:metal-responsive CopG/Arc/MetJ family transcriptional regulator
MMLSGSWHLMKSAKEMKVKTSVVLSQELLHTVDHYAVNYESRSQFIETALRVFIAHLMREEQHARDLDILNRCADELNQEVEDALSYQIPL